MNDPDSWVSPPSPKGGLGDRSEVPTITVAHSVSGCESPSRRRSRRRGQSSPERSSIGFRADSFRNERTRKTDRCTSPARGKQADDPSGLVKCLDGPALCLEERPVASNLN